jgi:hypothetical protein
MITSRRLSILAAASLRNVRGQKREGRGISPPTPRREIEDHRHHGVFWDLPEDHRHHGVFGEDSLDYQIYQ